MDIENSATQASLAGAPPSTHCRAMDAGSFDVIVAGAGPAGLAAACLCAAEGRRTVLIAGAGAPPEDSRTVALMQPAIRFLTRLEVWPAKLERLAAPLRKLRLVDDTGSLFHALDIVFDAKEIGTEPFGWNIPLAALIAALRSRAEELDIAIVASDAVALSASARFATVRLEGTAAVSAPLVIAADGRSSRIRKSAGIAVTEWSYEQTAIATSFVHSAPHSDISIEYHKPGGPFTTVPMPGRRSSLVWMTRPDHAAELMALDDHRFAAEIQVASHGELGLIETVGPRHIFGMGGLIAARLTSPRLLLIGEAAHVVPPIGAQGLNISLRDAAEAADLLIRHVDPGSKEVLAEYETSRRQDILSTQAVIDLMNRSLLAGELWLDGGRTFGLAALERFALWRRFVMRRGLAPAGPLPRAMRN